MCLLYTVLVIKVTNFSLFTEHPLIDYNLLPAYIGPLLSHYQGLQSIKMGNYNDIVSHVT